ncbi:MAG: hypothetical protein ACLTS6_03465 [Anaerobutyricum sp.]
MKKVSLKKKKGSSIKEENESYKIGELLTGNAESYMLLLRCLLK